MSPRAAVGALGSDRFRRAAGIGLSDAQAKLILAGEGSRLLCKLPDGGWKWGGLDRRYGERTVGALVDRDLIVLKGQHADTTRHGLHVYLYLAGHSVKRPKIVRRGRPTN